jgi:hypothetical protein
MVGEWDRVSDSVQPVHSWNDSQITDGRRALANASAMAGAMLAGSAINDAVMEQNFKNARRLTPWLCSTSPKVDLFAIESPPLLLVVAVEDRRGLLQWGSRTVNVAAHASCVVPSLRVRSIGLLAFCYDSRGMSKAADLRAALSETALKTEHKTRSGAVHFIVSTLL